MRILMSHAVNDVVAKMRHAGHTDDAKAAKYLRWVVGKQTPANFYTGTADKWRVDADQLHAAVLAHFEGVPNEIENEVNDLRAEIARLAEIIHRTTSLRDWLHGGYAVDDYKAFREQYRETDD